MGFYNRSQEVAISPADDIQCRYYLRFSVADTAGVLGGIADALAKQNISIASLTQKEARKGQDFVPVIITTYSATEKELKSAIAEIEKRDFVKAPTKLIRIED